MKRIKIYLLLLITSLMASCNALDLGPEDFYALNNYWNSPEQCDRFINGLHYRMRSRSVVMFQMGEVRGGLFNTSAANSTGESSNDFEAKNNALSATNPGLSNWGAFYTDIYQMNHAIDKITNECTFLSDAQRNRYLGQLYGMRAFYYFHLMRTWGGVMLCDKPDVLLTDDIVALNKPRSTEQETMQFVRNDVEASCRYFDQTSEKLSNSNWNRSASYCLLAEVYMWSAKVKPLKGSSVFSTNPQADLNAAKTALLALEPSYKPNPVFLDAFSVKNKDTNTETIFAFHNALNEAGTMFGNFTYNTMSITRFYDVNGVGLSDPLKTNGSSQRYEYALEFYKSLNDKDTRKSSSFYPYYEKDNDKNLILAGTAFKKFLGSTNNNIVQFDTDMPIYRYMDIALMLAEISNDLDQRGDVKTWIEVVRKRAYGAANMPVFTYTTKEAAEEAILAERKAEFMGEFKTWYDIRRMLGGKYALQLVNGNELKLVWPIDSGVLSKDNLVKQNEGYL